MLNSFFSPKSIAVIGASRTPGKVGFDILKNIIQYDYEGRVYPINPSADEILGKKSYPSLADVPDSVELAVVVVPAKNVLEVIEQCGKKKIGSAIIITAGFKESGVEGARLEHELVYRAAEAGVRFVGPNCLGIIDTHAKMNASFAAGMPAQGGIGFFSQSGALCLAVLDRALPDGIGFSKFISMGNKADITDTDIMRALAEDENTKVILGYIEGVSDGKKFMEVASEVSKKKPLIILKSGTTSSGAKAASSHTGALAGREATFDAAFRQSGVIRAYTLKDIFNFALAFASQPLPKGPYIAIITNSGGPGILAADACDKSDLQLVTLHKETIDKLREFLPPVASFYNPIDILGDSGAERYEKTLQLVLQDSSIQGVLVLLTPTATVDVASTARKVSYVSQFFEKPVMTSFMGKKSIESASRILMNNNIPNYEYPEEAVAAYHAMYRYHAWIKKPPKTFTNINVRKNGVAAIFEKVKQENRERFTDEEIHEVLETYGFRQPKGLFARTSEEAVAAAKRIGYPVVMKIMSPQVVHKSDIGGVRKNLNNKKDIENAFFEITTHVRNILPAATIYGVLIQEMIPPGKEVIIGITKDPQFGHMIMFGLGGIYVEVLRDISFRIVPLSNEDVHEMVREIKTFPLLRGVRGEAETDIGAIEQSLLSFNQLAMDFPKIIEADINPLLAHTRGKGVIAIDARFTIGGE
ncbi:MAG: acetate--CoA ligase [Thermodesulfovibrionales bacterium]|nr:acetate--CoA ligase [Thermodesulfovibrionales bacterium]